MVYSVPSLDLKWSWEPENGLMFAVFLVQAHWHCRWRNLRSAMLALLFWCLCCWPWSVTNILKECKLNVCSPFLGCIFCPPDELFNLFAPQINLGWKPKAWSFMSFPKIFLFLQCRLSLVVVILFFMQLSNVLFKSSVLFASKCCDNELNRVNNENNCNL